MKERSAPSSYGQAPFSAAQEVRKCEVVVPSNYTLRVVFPTPLHLYLGIRGCEKRKALPKRVRLRVDNKR